MNVEDSYEGAVRRLQRLEMAGIAMEPAPADAADESAAADDGGERERMRQLEELATLACEDNERLKAEFGVALQELDDTRRERDVARAAIARAQREVGEARHEIEQLRGYVATLEQTLAEAQQAAANAVQQAAANAAQQVFAPAPQQVFAPAPQQQVFTPAAQQAFQPAPQQAFQPAAQQAFQPAPQQAFEPAAQSPSAFVSPFATEALPDEDYGYPPKSSGKGAKYFFVLATAGAAITALCVLHPWDPPHAAPIAVEQPAPPPPVVTAPPPVVTAPAPAPKLAPTVPTVAPAIPKAAPVAAAHAPRAAKSRAERKHPTKHHAAKKHTANAESTPPGTTDDPLGGTNL